MEEAFFGCFTGSIVVALISIIPALIRLFIPITLNIPDRYKIHLENASLLLSGIGLGFISIIAANIRSQDLGYDLSIGSVIFLVILMLVGLSYGTFGTGTDEWEMNSRKSAFAIVLIGLLIGIVAAILAS